MSTAAAAMGSPYFSDGLDDVDEFVLANEGEQAMSWDRFQQVFDFVKVGNRAYRQERLEEAINCYSKANSIKPNDPIILGNRAAAYIRISRFLRGRSPSASEYSPLNGLDPTIHAELALKDAEKVMSTRSNFLKPYLLQANALILLEKYELARDAILSGLQIDPLSNPLRTLLQILERTYSSSSARRNAGKPERSDDFDCTLCLKLLYDPITTPCGHTFCRSCLFQSMDRSNKCPLCRTVLFNTPRTCATSVTLNNIIQKTFPEEYAERKLEHKSLTNLGVDLIPLFVMDAVLPCQKFPLNIFEPRYRLMVRRIMEGNHRMGMVIVDSTTGDIADFACEVEITEYRVAEVEWIHDIFPSEGTREKLDLHELTRNAADYAQAWMSRAKEAARQDRRRLVEILNAEAMMPSPEDPERFSFWLTTLSKRRPSERLELLRLRDTKERITRALLYLRQEEQGCRVQ
ncbi:LON peptidase N-terminal domain and RING finger protein 3-like protein [Drosera capensis]